MDGMDRIDGMSRPVSGAILVRVRRKIVDSSTQTSGGHVRGIFVVLSSLAILAAVPVDAQLPPFRLGVTGGVAFATLAGDVQGANFRDSPYYGAVIVFQSPGFPVGFGSGLIYVSKGAETSVGPFDGTLRLNYLEIPLLARIGLDLPDTNITPTLVLGPSLGLQVSCDVVAETSGVTVAADCEDSGFQGAASFKTIDYGWSIGSEVDLPVGQATILSPTIRYTRGLRSIPENNDDDVKNSVFQLGIIVRVAI